MFPAFDGSEARKEAESLIRTVESPGVSSQLEGGSSSTLPLKRTVESVLQGPEAEDISREVLSGDPVMPGDKLHQEGNDRAVETSFAQMTSEEDPHLLVAEFVLRVRPYSLPSLPLTRNRLTLSSTTVPRR